MPVWKQGLGIMEEDKCGAPSNCLKAVEVWPKAVNPESYRFLFFLSCKCEGDSMALGHLEA